MKQIFLIVFSLCVASYVSAQTGIGTETPDGAAALHVVAPNNNGGVLIPTLDSTQIANIINPTHSLLVYNTTKNKFMFNAGSPATPLWTFVGDIPLVDNITNITTGSAGDVRYSKATGEIFYWKVGTGWTQLRSVAGP